MAAVIGLFVVIHSFGQSLSAPPAELSGGSAVKDASAKVDALRHVLLALAAVILLGRLIGGAFRYLHQPPVIGEVVAGILLGPSLLGKDLSAYILPDVVAPSLGMIAQLGVILYMFLVGLELNAGQLRGRGYSTLAISHASIVLPFLLGAGLALWLYPLLSNQAVSFASFALFLGMAMSITAFPVLARILHDRGMTRTELGVMALSCAAIDDVTAWCLLAFVVGVAQAQVSGALVVLTLAVAFIGFMLLAARPLVKTYLAGLEESQITTGVLAWVFLAVLLAALAGEVIGIHALFGAFLLGAIIPHDSALAHVFTKKLTEVVTVLLLPAFFAYTGMRTQIGLISGVEQWFICGVLILVATAGKFGGCLIAGRLTGLSWRPAAALGVLMNTRGLMELIVLNIGLDLGVISPTLFAMMVLMALATTLATTPVLWVLDPDRVEMGEARKANAKKLSRK